MVTALSRSVQPIGPWWSRVWAILFVAGTWFVPGVGSAAAPEARGDFTLGVRHYPSPSVPGRDLEWTLAARAEIRWDARPSLRLFITPRVHADPLDPGRWRWVPDEAWVEARRGPARLRLGRTVTRWGSTDAANPTDVVAVRDWGIDFLDPERPGDWSAVFSVTRARWGLEALVLPVLEGARQPSARSRWSLQSAGARSGFPVDVLLDDTPRLPPGTGEASVAGRVRLTRGATDVYLVGYSGIDHRPLLTGTVDFEHGVVTARTTYLPLHLGGIEVQSALGDFLVKGAVTYEDRSVDDAAFAAGVFGDFGLRPRSWQGIAGLEYLWLDFLGSPGVLDLTAEYVWDNSPGGDSIRAFRPLQNDVAVGATYRFGDLADTRVEAGWLEDLERPESVFLARVSRRIGDRVRWELGADVLRGGNDPSSPFYLYSPNDRVTARVTGGF